ncbi:MAG: hypothetical protein ACKOBT_07705 [Actinomycetota bacterium]
MDNETFRNLAANEVKGQCSQNQRAFLAEHFDDWREALRELDTTTGQRVADLEAQLVGLRARMTELTSIPSELIILELELVGKVEKSAHFLKHVRARLASLNSESSIIRSAGSDEAEFLRRAIETHKRVLDDGADADRADAALYAALDGAWKFDEILQVG